MNKKQVQDAIATLEAKQREARSNKDYHAYLEDWPTANHYAGEVKAYTESINVLKALLETKKLTK